MPQKSWTESSGAQEPCYLIVADSSSLRWSHYQRELISFWQQKGLEGGPRVHLMEWSELLAEPETLGQAEPTDPVLLRVESPGRDPNLIQQLESFGGYEGSDPTQTGESPSAYGVWCGIRRALDSLGKLAATQPSWTLCQRFDDLVELFDKNATFEKLKVAGIPTPDSFRPESLAHLQTEVQARGWASVFVKAAYGSCAAGMVQAELSSRWSGISTLVRRSDGRFGHARRPQRLDGRELEEVLQFIIDRKATAQVAVRKARFEGKNFDVRLVVIGDRVEASIFRLSPYPMTNLHLGGMQGNSDLLQRWIPQRAWCDALSACASTARLYAIPALGVDLAFEEDTFRPFVLEVNSFGDFFPRWTNAQGRSVASLEIEATARKMGWIT